MQKHASGQKQWRRGQSAGNSKRSGSESEPRKSASRVSKQSQHAAPKGVALLPERFPERSIERICPELFRPQASGIFVAGSFNNWNPSATPLQNRGDGRWTVDLVLERGKYEYFRSN